MARLAILLVMFACGCSTAPVADVLDFVRPGRIGPGPYRGGVGEQHSTPEPTVPPLHVPPPPGSVPLP